MAQKTTYGLGGYLPGEPNADSVQKAWPDLPPANIVAIEQTAPEPDAPVDPAPAIADALTALNEGRAGAEQIQTLTELLAGGAG